MTSTTGGGLAAVVPPPPADDLRLEHIGMQFDERLVLHDVSTTFVPGRISGLVGHNGSGKSTIIKLLAGFHRPTAGRIRLGDTYLDGGSSHSSYASGLRFVHQELALVSEFNAMENFGLGAGFDVGQLRSVNWKAQRRRLRSGLDLLQATLPLDVPVGELTAVERALLAIARAIAPAPDGAAARFLMLDEPTTTLEEPEKRKLFGVLQRLGRQGIGVLYVSHQLDEVLGLCDTVTVLREGYVVDHLRTEVASYEHLVSAMLGETEEQQAVLAHRRGGPAASVAPVDQKPATGAAGQAPVLSVRGLTSKSLRKVDLEVGPGECVCVVGLSGSGRDELIYAVAGAVPSSADSTEISGERVRQLTPKECRRRRIGIVPGNRLPGSMVADFTVQENLTFASLGQMTRRGAIDSHRESSWVDERIRQFDVRPPVPSLRARFLSGGNKQKVILAKWLGIDPVALLIDEPTAGVDVGAIQAILEILRKTADGGTGLLISTSEVADILSIADRVVIFRHGRVIREIRQGAEEWSESNIVQIMSS